MAKDKSKSGRKIGRNKRHQAPAYRAEMRYEKNRKKRWRRTLREQPGNKQLLAVYEKTIGPYEGQPSARAVRKSQMSRDARRALKAALVTVVPS